MARVLLTGAGGFAGHHCLEHVLAATDWDVVATDSFKHRGKTDRIAQVLDGHPGWRARVDVVTHDLSVPFSQQAFLRMIGQGIDFMICFASDSHVGRSIADPVPFAQNNVNVALSTLELAREIDPAAVVWVSTDEVYGPVQPGQPGFSEWAPVVPSNVYSASKVAQEALCIAYWRTYGVPVFIVNCVNMLGERQDPEKFVPKTIRALSRGEPVTIHKGGSRHYLHARNVADAIVFLLNTVSPAYFPAAQPWSDGGPHRFADRLDRFNIASQDRIANLEMARMIADAAGMKLEYRFEDFHATRPGHDMHYGLDPGKLAALGWKPPVPFRESLDRLVQWSLANQAWLEE